MNRQIAVTFYTQGCRLNQSETSSLKKTFLDNQNFNVVHNYNEADVCVINTCTVTENGDADTRKLVRKCLSENHTIKVALIGCQSQIFKKELLKLKGVFWVVGNQDKFKLDELIFDTFNSNEPVVHVTKIKAEPFRIASLALSSSYTRASIKIQDGCDFYCSFCVIPFARGKARSRVLDDVIKEGSESIKLGLKEMVLTGVNIGTYNYNGKTITDLLNSLLNLKGKFRVRLSSIEPTTIPDSIIDEMAKSGSSLCPMLHIPIQSASDSILKLMSRKYSYAEYKAFIIRCYETIPDLCLGTDVIVGFPGESDADFEETFQHLLELPLHYFHVFSYSDRRLARSQKLENHVPRHVIADRSKRLRCLSDEKKRQFYKRYKNKELEVLFEQEKQGYWYGYSKNYIRVRIPSKGKSLRNQLLPVYVHEINEDKILCEGLL